MTPNTLIHFAVGSSSGTVLVGVTEEGVCAILARERSAALGNH